MTLQAELRAVFQATQTGANDFGGPSFVPAINKILQFASGTAANQADILWGDERTISASSSENLDLAGVLTDAFGAAVAAVELVAILIIANAANTNNVVVGGAASNAVPLFGGTLGTISVPPGGFFYAAGPGAAGLCTVTPSSGDILKVANSAGGTGVTYQIIILGRTA